MNRNLGGIGAGGIYPNSFLASSKNLSFTFCILLVAILGGQEVLAGSGTPGGSRSVCLGGSFVAVAGDVWSLDHNPAGLALLDHFQCAVFLLPQQFGLTELRTISFAAGFPLSSTAVGLGIEQFGFALYREIITSVAVGSVVGEGMYAGATLQYEYVSISGYGSTGILLFDAGLGTEPLPGLLIGFFARNVMGARIGATGQRLPRTVTLGAGYKPFADFLLTFDIEKDVRYPATVKAGVEQAITEFAALRFGISTIPDVASLGFEIWHAGIVFGYAASSHPDLGWSQSVELKLQVLP